MINKILDLMDWIYESGKKHKLIIMEVSYILTGLLIMIAMLLCVLGHYKIIDNFFIKIMEALGIWTKN